MRLEKAVHHGGHGDTAETKMNFAVSPCSPWLKQGVQDE
jgi:hypothetical protein